MFHGDWMFIVDLAEFFVFFDLIPGLIIGHWAKWWGRDRFEWTAASILTSALVTGLILLIIGRKEA
jgi:hypothetical protein